MLNCSVLEFEDFGGMLLGSARSASSIGRAVNARIK